jgi:C4-dicarboxylate transporter DctM subunit
MSPVTIGLIGIGCMFLMMALRVPIAFSMASVGFVGFIYLSSMKSALSIMAIEPFSTSASYALSTLPMFVLMGQVAFHAGISERLYDTAYKWLGNLPGGLAMATVGACAGFAAICGSTLATAATMGTVALPEMKRHKYASSLSTGCIAAGGTLGILIPPSGIMIIYGVLTEQSISQLFIAGIIPGIILALLFMITIYIRVKFSPEMGPPAPPVSMKEKITSLGGTGPVLALFLLVMGGLYGGIFTANEAAGIGAAGAIVIGVSRRKLPWVNFTAALTETMRTTAMILIIIISAHILMRFLSLTTLPDYLSEFVGGLNVPPVTVIIVIFAIYIVLGCIMDSMAMLLITIPIFFPLILTLGYDPVWFGVFLVIVMELAAITPPIGINVYVIHGVAKDVPMSTIFKGIVPFIFPMIICAVILILYPQTALFLPGTMK